MIQKMGSYFVSLFAVRVDEEKIKLIAENCPNIKILKIRLFIAEPRSENVDLGILNKCKQLTQLSLYLVHQGGDSSLNEIVTSESLEELIILKHKRLTGSFLTNMRTSLKTLIFVDCDSLSIENILFVADRLKALTRLELIRNEMWNLQNAHLLLDGTPNLERLCLQNRNYLRSPWINLGHELPTAIGRLSRLRELRLWNNEFVTDEWLAIVARGCPALRSIEVWCPHVSAHGLLALCRTRPELKQLVVRHPTMKDREIEACVRSCEGLELLDVSFCDRLTRNLPERLAWPRARPLRLRIYNLLRRKSEVMTQSIPTSYHNVVRPLVLTYESSSNIKKNREKIENFANTADSGRSSRQTIKVREYPLMEDALYTKRRVVQKFKPRLGIRLLTVTGEKLSSGTAAVAAFVEKFKKKVNDLSLIPDQVYNADESGLFWRVLPNKTYVYRKESEAPGRKVSKDELKQMLFQNNETELTEQDIDEWFAENSDYQPVVTDEEIINDATSSSEQDDLEITSLVPGKSR
ncbi:hypothetical protein MSG28_015064 [Choristoneura fumiferana]|uniref:Uncharacterized protein n=1 Tax=Choristoneura fumiferana TaxID=7141 RepID=A0ACC0KYY4_CHOFU|nr:hypothetical protein MSG28_015064 [Choristoneura fumiferana]